MNEQSKAWQNRIVGYGEEPPDQLMANPYNFRVHPSFQQDALLDVLDRVGIVQNILVNKRSGALIDGHLRVVLALRNEQPTVPVTYVDLSEDEEKLILATYDPLTALATHDVQVLNDLLHQINTDSPVLQQLLSDVAEAAGVLLDGNASDGDNNYSRKIEAPIYEPSASKPAASELFDTSKTDTLVTEINQDQTLTDGERAFLIAAAQRHTVINFTKVADYYAHSPAHIQRLFENSALVIIDFDRAIELGFVKLTERIAQLVEDEYGDE